MSVPFLNTLNLIVGASDYSNVTRETCKETINHYTFYQFTLIPAVLISLFFTITKKRRKVLQRLWSGRPGLIFPMDTLTRSSRISYACSFGATAFLVYRVVLEQTYAINYIGKNRAVKSFVIIGSMVIYGMIFFPLFTSLAVGSVYGYTIGVLYVWMLTGVEIYKSFECSNVSAEARVLVILRGLPSLLCLAYLSLTIPVRAVMACRRRHRFDWREGHKKSSTLADIRASYAGHHVTELFWKPVVEKTPDKLTDRIIGIIQSLFHRFVYQRKKGFRYPARILSVLFVAVIVVYTLTFEFLTLLPRTLDLYIDGIILYMEYTIGVEQDPAELSAITTQRNVLWAAWWALGVIKICIIVSNVLALIFALVNVLHTLSSYRANMLALYRGDHSDIPPASASSNTSHCINSIKYAGFQVGYIIWSYLIQFGIFTLLSFICALIVTLIKYDLTFWIFWFLELIWPILVTVILITFSQLLLAKFVFLQERGAYLALNNRGVYFNFTYFMFFYNIFLGLASCIMRILKAMLVGISFLSRLDSSTMPRRFEFFDPGFKAYVGYMHMEAAHTHPVLVVFCRLMVLGLKDKLQREGQKTAGAISVSLQEPAATYPPSGNLEQMFKNNRVHTTKGDSCFENSAVVTLAPDLSEEERRRKVAARFNWHVMYTLLHNPDIRVMRKGYMQMLRQARLMGVYIPVSDRQADIDMEQLQESLADAKEKLNPQSKKKGNEGKEDVVVNEEEEELGKTGAPVENGVAKNKAVDMSSAGVLAAQVAAHVDQSPPSHSTVPTEEKPFSPAEASPQSSEKPESSVSSNPQDTDGQEQRKSAPVSEAPSEQMSLDICQGHGPGQHSAQQGRAAPPEEPRKHVTTIHL